jgi:transposase-like protein
MEGLFVSRDALKELVETVANQVLEAQVAQHLGVDWHERSSERQGHRNGYKPRTMKTRVGELQLRVPQVREGGFAPTLFERYQRSEKALLIALQEMFIKGVSTRDVTDVLEKMGGFSVSAGLVSRAATDIDDAVRKWRSRPLNAHAYPYLMIDARYEKVRRNSKIESVAMLIAAGVDEEGHRDILGYYLGDSESESTWGEAFADLKARGLSGVELAISDAHQGIRAGLDRHLLGVAWQRCQAHFLRELLSKASWRDRKELAQDLRSIYVSEEKEQCQAVAEEVAAKWEARLPKMSRALRAGVEDTLTVQHFPSEHRRRLHTTNMLERQMREFKSRTRKVSIFPNESSCIRLFGALCLEISEAWQGETKRFLNMERR